jgi:hypothetical protein
VFVDQIPPYAPGDDQQPVEVLTGQFAQQHSVSIDEVVKVIVEGVGEFLGEMRRSSSGSTADGDLHAVLHWTILDPELTIALWEGHLLANSDSDAAVWTLRWTTTGPELVGSAEVEANYQSDPAWAVEVEVVDGECVVSFAGSAVDETRWFLSVVSTHP